MDYANTVQLGQRRELLMANHIPRHCKGRNDPLSERLRYRLRVHYASSLDQQASHPGLLKAQKTSSAHHNLRHTACDVPMWESPRSRVQSRAGSSSA